MQAGRLLRVADGLNCSIDLLALLGGHGLLSAKEPQPGRIRLSARDGSVSEAYPEISGPRSVLTARSLLARTAVARLGALPRLQQSDVIVVMKRSCGDTGQCGELLGSVDNLGLFLPTPPPEESSGLTLRQGQGVFPRFRGWNHVDSPGRSDGTESGSFLISFLLTNFLWRVRWVRK